MPSPEASSFSFPDHTIAGYYKLSDGSVFVPEQLMQFDRFCLVRAFLNSGEPIPDTYISVAKGAQADSQEISYLIGTANEQGQRDVLIYPAQTRRFDHNNKALPQPEVRVFPTRKQLAGSWMGAMMSRLRIQPRNGQQRVYGLLDDMLDEGKTLKVLDVKTEKTVPKGSIVIPMVPVAKRKIEEDGRIWVSDSARVIGREVEDMWMRMANQFESLQHKHDVMQEVRATYKTYDQDMTLYHADTLIRHFFPDIIEGISYDQLASA